MKLLYIFSNTGSLIVICFKIYREVSENMAHDFDMGNFEFIINGQIISSRGDTRLLNMIYISLLDLIDNLLVLKVDANAFKGACRNYDFVAADSSFRICFEIRKNELYIRHRNVECGPFALTEFLRAIDSGIDSFLLDPRNELPIDGSMYRDFNASRLSLKTTLAN